MSAPGRLRRLIVALAVCAGLPAVAVADEMLIARSARDFDETMSALQNAITARGYKISRVQRVDVGLQAKGYQTDKYRVVFYGRPQEVAALAERHPELIPYLPLSVAILAEGEQTLVTTSRPRVLGTLFPDPDLRATFERWEQDLIVVFDEMRELR